MTTTVDRAVLELATDDAALQAGIERAKRGARTLGEAFGVTRRDLEAFGREATTLGSLMSTVITLPLVAAGAGATKAAVDFESSFAGVRKTVNATESEFAALAQGFRNLAKEIPVNVNELNKVGEAAGQLGIKKDAIIGFTEVMAELGVTTNLTSDEAATSLARLANITQMPQTEFGRLGSTIVALGNNFATTEREIVEFGVRIAGAGKQAGMSEPSILAIGTALSSLGVEAEAGGTAVQKVLLEMVKASAQGGDAFKLFAKTAGMSAQEFATLFERDASAAFTTFVEGLGREGKNAINVLAELGLEDQRLIRSFLALSGSGDLLRRSVELGNVAWRENTALSKEAAERFGTTQSQLTLLWNRLVDVGITFGNALLPGIRSCVELFTFFLPVLDGAAHAFAALPGPLQMIAIGAAAILAAAGPALFVLGQLASSVATLGLASNSHAAATTTVAATQARATVAAKALEVETLRVAAATNAADLATKKYGVTALQTMNAKVALARAEAAHVAALARNGAAQAAVTASATAGAAQTGMLARAMGALGISTGLASSAIAFLTNPITLAVAGTAALGAGIYYLSTRETELEKAVKSNTAAFREKNDRLQTALATYDSLRGKLKPTEDESRKLAAATRELAAASGLAESTFKREADASSALTDRLREQLKARKDLFQRHLDELRSSAADALNELESYKAALARVMRGEGTREEFTGKDISRRRKLTPEEETQEIERLTRMIAELEQKANAARQAYRDAAGTIVGDIQLVASAEVRAREEKNQLAEATRQVAAADRKYRDELKGISEVLAFQIRNMEKTGETTKTLADRYHISEQTVSRFKRELEASVVATKKADTEAERHAKTLDKQRDALQKLGVVTETTVNTALDEFETLVSHAAAAGVPMDTILAAIAPRLAELKKQADASGVSVRRLDEGLDLATDAAARLIDNALALINLPFKEGIDDLAELPGQIVNLSDIFDLAGMDARNLADSMAFFGIKSRSELQQTARDAVAHYNTIKKSGQATVAALKEAEEKKNAALAAAGEETESRWTKVFNDLQQLARDFGKGVATLLGDGIRTGDWSQFENQMKGLMSEFMGSAIAAGVNAIAPGVGTMLQPLFSAISDKFLGALGLGTRGRDMMRAFFNEMGGEAALRTRLIAQMGDAAAERWMRQLHQIGRDNVKQAEQTIAAVKKALEEAEQRTAAFNQTLGGMLGRIRELGTGLPESLRNYLRELQNGKQLTQENIDLVAELAGRGQSDWKKIQEAVQRYGGDIATLGGTFQSQRLHDAWQQVIDDMELFEQGGISAADATALVKDEVIDLIKQSVKFGTEIPENLREMALAYAENGELIDENGEKITASQLKFGETMQTSIQKLTEEIKRLVDQLMKVPSAIRAIPRTIDVGVNYRETRSFARDDPGEDDAAGLANAMGFPFMRMEHGDAGLRRPTLTLAAERGSDDYAYSGVGRSLAGGRMLPPIVIESVTQLDGAEVARNQIRHFPRELHYAGVWG